MLSSHFIFGPDFFPQLGRKWAPVWKSCKKRVEMYSSAGPRERESARRTDPLSDPGGQVAGRQRGDKKVNRTRAPGARAPWETFFFFFCAFLRYFIFWYFTRRKGQIGSFFPALALLLLLLVVCGVCQRLAGCSRQNSNYSNFLKAKPP